MSRTHAGICSLVPLYVKWESGAWGLSNSGPLTQVTYTPPWCLVIVFATLADLVPFSDSLLGGLGR